MKFLISLLLITLSLAASSQAAYDIFVRFVGGNAPAYEGDSLNEYYHKSNGWMEVNSVNFSLENNVNIGSTSGGAGAGRASFGAVTINKATNPASASLFAAAAAGLQYETVEVVFWRSGSNSEDSLFLKFEMKLVLVERVEVDVLAGGDVPEETVVLKHGAQRLTFYKTNIDGSSTALTPVSWSIVLNNSEFAVE